MLSDLEWKNEKTVKKVFSNPKRLSFILGLNSKIYTPKSQLINLGKLKIFQIYIVDLISRLFLKNFMKNIKIFMKN